MAPRKPLEVRYSTFHAASMAVIAVGLIVSAIVNFISTPENLPRLSLNDPRFVLYVLMGVALLFYAGQGVRRYVVRTPQITIDADGITVGFGRDKRLAWNDIVWIRGARVSMRRELQIGLEPEAFLAADLKLSMWNLDDNVRQVRGAGPAFGVREAGLDMDVDAMVAAARAYRPNLVKG